MHRDAATRSEIQPSAPSFEIPSRVAVGSPGVLSELRHDVFRSVGPELGQGILYGVGFSEGVIDALRVVKEGRRPAQRDRLCGPALPILLQPASSDARRLCGTAPGALEAKLHLERFDASADPICVVTAGYAAGWYTELLDEPVLVREHHCHACGDALCRFEARRVEDWGDDARIGELAAYLDIRALRARARELLDDDDTESNDEGDLFGSFDSLSPTVHVWGPLMVLPYSGAADCAAAIDTIVADVGAGHVRVVVVDVLGMRVEPLEMAGLTRVLAYARDNDMEAVVVGIAPQASGVLGGDLSNALRADSLTQGITLGFQMVHTSLS